MLNYILLLLITINAAVSVNSKPNFVIILTDDQDVTLGGMKHMKNVKELLADEGTTFNKAYTSSPICCPSRASFLSGMYVHNHRTFNNSMEGGCYGEFWRQKVEMNTFAAILQNDGYNTFYAGKYLNQYGLHPGRGCGPARVPAGWAEWRGLAGNSVYYNYTISNNGVPTWSADLYLTDVVKELAVSFVEKQTETRPFLLVAAPPAPHQPCTPAPRHAGRLPGAAVPRTPHFNVPAKDKHWLLAMEPSPLPRALLAELDAVQEARLEALLAVDELVRAVLAALARRRLLDDSYVVYTSDNGYHIGQFSQVYDKRQPYESDIKVPLIIRGPRMKKNHTSSQPALNIDLAPTILEAAGLTPPAAMDGASLLSGGLQEREMLIEYHGEGAASTVDSQCPWAADASNLAECSPRYACKCQDARNNTYRCVRRLAADTDVKFCQFDDQQQFLEMYDLSADPYELRNVAEEVLPSVRGRYQRALRRLAACRGRACLGD